MSEKPDMRIPRQLESLCSRAFLAIRYENAGADDSLTVAAAQLSDADKELLLGFLDTVAADKNAASIILNPAVRQWAERFGMDLDSDVVPWLLSARSALQAGKGNA
jgi:hypothetical protein